MCQLFHAADMATYESMNFTEHADWTTFYRVETYSANKMVDSDAGELVMIIGHVNNIPTMHFSLEFPVILSQNLTCCH